MDEFERALLTKGLDLFADWVRSRWRRRRPGGGEPGTDSVDDRPEVAPQPTDRDTALLDISEAILAEHKAELASVIERLEIHQRNIHHLQAQRAKWGESLVPPIVTNSLIDEEAAVDALADRLGDLLEAISRRPLRGLPELQPGTDEGPARPESFDA